MAILHEALKSYGLSEKQIIVYLACVGKIALSAQEIADRTDLSRQVVYDHMKRLIHDGLITTIHMNSSLKYQATSPKKLLQNIENTALLLKDALPKIQELQEIDTSPSTVELHKGIAAVRCILTDALTCKQDLLWITDYEQARELFRTYEFHNLTLKRVEAHTRLKIIIGSTPLHTDAMSVWKTDKKQFRETRSSFEADGLKTTTIIYTNTVVMIDMTTATPQAVVIKDVQIAETQRRLFMSLWKTGKHI